MDRTVLRFGPFPSSSPPPRKTTELRGAICGDLLDRVQMGMLVADGPMPNGAARTREAALK
jgi:predicted component of type VI protein secretion system